VPSEATAKTFFDALPHTPVKLAASACGSHTPTEELPPPEEDVGESRREQAAGVRRPADSKHQLLKRLRT